MIDLTRKQLKRTHFEIDRLLEQNVQFLPAGEYIIELTDDSTRIVGKLKFIKE